MRDAGYPHPLGDDWRGIQDITPEALPRERVLKMLKDFNPEAFLAVTYHGTPTKVASLFKGYVDAGASLVKVMDYGGMAGLKYAASAGAKLRKTEDELVRLCS
jgi:phthiodiolone/phenolphthiodiolone dimycocerosates ketoreductase